MRIRRIGYVAGMVLLVLLVVVGLGENAVKTEVFGVGTQGRSDVGDGYRLTVRYPTVTRGALATPFDVRIHRAGGFDGPIQVAIAWPWLEMWDENSWYPAPSKAWGGRRAVRHGVRSAAR